MTEMMRDADPNSVPHVLDILRARKDSGSQPQHRTDPYKIALIAESGGMKGTLMGAAAAAFEQSGYTPCFDMMIGSSTGAGVLSYMVAGHVTDGATLYIEHLCGPEFIHPPRLLPTSPRSLMCLDYVIDEVFDRLKPLDYQAILDSPIPLILQATTPDGRPHLLENFKTRKELERALQATFRFPVIAGHPKKEKDLMLYDGALTGPLPIQAALERGATHIVALMGDSACKYARFSPLESLVVIPSLALRAPGAARLIFKRHVLCNQARDFFRKAAHHAVFAPEPQYNLRTPLFQDRRFLLECMVHMYTTTYTRLNGTAPKALPDTWSKMSALVR